MSFEILVLKPKHIGSIANIRPEMKVIDDLKHTIETFYYALSRMLERASFYGFRALLVLYVTSDTLQMDNAEAMVVYSVLTSSLLLSPIIGALFGDLLIGNKKCLFLGGITQATGAFCLCIPSLQGLYIGLFLVVLGSGFYTPNIISTFGKLYLKKTKLLDSGFTILHLAINLGSFFGILLIGYIGETFSHTIGFVFSGILMLTSLIPILFAKENIKYKFEKDKYAINLRALRIALALLLVALFWNFYEMASIRIFDLESKFSAVSAFDWSKNIWQSMSFVFMVPISAITIFLYSYFYSSQIFKVMLGFIFGTLACGLLLLIPEFPAEQNAMVYLLSLMLLSLAEIHIAPVIHSLLTKFSNPKYLAILISSAFVPTKLVSLLFVLYHTPINEDPILGLEIAIVAMACIGIGLIGIVGWNKRRV